MGLICHDWSWVLDDWVLALLLEAFFSLWEGLPLVVFLPELAPFLWGRLSLRASSRRTLAHTWNLILYKSPTGRLQGDRKTSG